MYIYFNKVSNFIEAFSAIGFKFLKSSYLSIFILLLHEKILEENGIRM